MGFAGVGRSVAAGADGVERGCAAAAPARDRDQLWPHLWSAPRLQLRRRQAAARRAARLADDAGPRALSDLRLLLREPRLVLGTERRPEVSAPHALRRVVRGRGTEL